MSKLTLYFFVFVAAYSLWSCNTSKPTTTISNSNKDPMTADYYLKYSGVEERLAQLMSGTFDCYSVRKKGTWKVNNDKDSIMAYAIPVGDVNRQGTWVYREILMTNFPEEPAVQAFYKIEKISPDSLLVQEYWPKSKKNPYKGLQHKKVRNFNEEDLTTNYCPFYVIKLGQAEFHAYTPNRCKRNKDKKMSWVTSDLRFLPEHTRSESKVYATEEFVPQDSTKFNHTILYFRRLKQ